MFEAMISGIQDMFHNNNNMGQIHKKKDGNPFFVNIKAKETFEKRMLSVIREYKFYILFALC